MSIFWRLSKCNDNGNHPNKNAESQETYKPCKKWGVNNMQMFIAIFSTQLCGQMPMEKLTPNQSVSQPATKEIEMWTTFIKIYTYFLLLLYFYFGVVCFSFGVVCTDECKNAWINLHFICHANFRINQPLKKKRSAKSTNKTWNKHQKVSFKRNVKRCDEEMANYREKIRKKFWRQEKFSNAHFFAQNRNVRHNRRGLENLKINVYIKVNKMKKSWNEKRGTLGEFERKSGNIYI